MKRIPILALVLCALLAVGQGYRLARAPKVGQELKYRLRAEFDLLGTSGSLAALVTERVAVVDEKGNYTLESRQTETSAKYGDSERPLPDSGTDTAVYTSAGEPLQIKTGNPFGVQGRLARLNAIVVPDKELKIGDSWTHDFEPSPLTGGTGGRAEYKATGTEKLGAKTALVIQFTYKETNGDSPAESSVKAWVDVETGELLKMESSQKNAPMMGPKSPINVKIWLTRE